MGLTVLNLFSQSENATAYRQLTLLGSTSIALSIASGWTTWDGMANFTDNPVLSFLITFGIQGVMLIAAWLIGETFVRSRHDIARGKRSDPRTPTLLGLALGGLFVFSAVIFVMDPTRFMAQLTSQLAAWSWGTYAVIALIAFIGVVVLISFRSRSGDRDPAWSYGYSLIVYMKHLPLWIMFLTCLAASVFFSFDSLFDTIFSPEDRKRASHTRMQGEVARLLTGLSNEVEQHRQTALASLFASPQWAAYDRGIDALISGASKAAATIHAQQDDDERRREKEIAAQRAAIAAAESRLASLEAQLGRAQDELSTSSPAVEEAERLAQERAKQLAARRSELRFKAAEAEAEVAGVGVTQLAGEGPRFRELKQEEMKLQISVSLLEKLLEDANRDLARQAEARKSLLAQAVQLEGQAATIKNEIAAMKAQLTALPSGAGRFSATLEKSAEQVEALNEARLGFVSAPTSDGFRELQRRCEALSAMLKSTAGAPQAADAACPADALSEITDKVFAANAASDFFRRECGKETRYEALETDALVQLGQKCLQASGLQNAATAAFQGDLRQASLRRDDRAHRFIVTWNAFFDRNPLAFVALFIAVAMDGLIFMSGLFGARARAEMTMGLAESAKDGRNSEVMLDTALLPEAQERARLVLEAIDFSNGQGDTVGHVDISKVESSRAGALRAVLNAATVLGMARPAGGVDRFAVTQKLLEGLSHRLGCARGLASGTVSEIDAEDLLRLSMGRNARDIVRLLLQAVCPLPPGGEFTHDMEINRLPQDVRDRLITVLNAGVAGACVAADADVPGRYLMNPAFFSMIARIVTAEEPYAAGPQTVALGTRQSRLLLSAARVEPERSPELPSRDAAETPPIPQTQADAHRPEPEASPPQPPVTPASPAASGNDRDVGRQIPDDAAEPVRPAAAKGEPGAEASRPSPTPRERPVLRPANDVAAPQSSTNKPRAPKVEADDRAPSTLVVFPADLAGRRAAQDGRGLPRAAASTRGDALLPKEALAGLCRATGLGKAELLYLVDPKSGPMFESACNALKALCATDETLDRRLRQLEQALWTKIQSSLPSRAVISMYAETADRLVTNSFARIFLCTCGLSETRAWCDNLVMEQELLASAGGISKRDGQSLGRIVQQLPALMAVDDNHRSSWKELMCRIDRLRVMPDFGTALGEIMP